MRSYSSRPWLKVARKAKGLTQTALAKALGVSLRAVQQWEGGETAPARETMFRLEALLGPDVAAGFRAEAQATEPTQKAG